MSQETEFPKDQRNQEPTRASNTAGGNEAGVRQTLVKVTLTAAITWKANDCNSRADGRNAVRRSVALGLRQWVHTQEM